MLMSGINRELTPHSRTSLFDKHLPGTPQVARMLRKEGKAHVFQDRATMEFVVQAIRHLQEWRSHSWSSFRMSPMRSLTSGWRSPTNETMRLSNTC